MSELALKLIKEAKEKRLTRLDLGNCGLTELPDELFELVWLEELKLSNNNKLQSLKSINVLSKLHTLEISKTLISDLNPLESLNLKILTCVKSEISNLNPLKKLYNLKVLILSENRLADITPLRELVNIEYLSLHCNPVVELNPIKGLINLKVLSLSETSINEIEALSDMKYLKSLDISKTKVKHIDSLSNLFQLQQLNLSNTEISNIEPINNLLNLSRLDLNATKVTSLLPLIRLISKPISVKNDNSGIGITVLNCNMIYPPHEIIIQGTSSTLRYLQQAQRQKGTVELYEAKLIIVGEGGTGKTTLFEKLKNNNHPIGNTPETHGINIHEGLTFKHTHIGNNIFHANLWDFGGQELQYMTHQFFLTPRALYVLMMDARRESPNLSYWFKIITLLGKYELTEKEKIRLLLVFNKRSNSTGAPPQYQDQLKYYKDSLDVDYIEIDLADKGNHWKSLRSKIEEKLVTLPIVKSQLPRLWKVVREDLRDEAKTESYITTKRFSDICSKHGITEEADQWLLSGYLHQLGSLLHFQTDKGLRRLVILSPQWAVDGVYTFLSDESIARNNGQFTEEAFIALLATKGYNRDDADVILQLMTKNNFDICYEATEGNYVAAQLLPDNAPQYKWFPKEVLQFRYQYPIMPKGLMSRLIVRLSDNIERDKDSSEQIVWKKGVVLHIKLKEGECRVRLREDDAESKAGLRQILIDVMGERDARKYALRKVRDTVDDLHKKWFKSVKADEMVPCCCSECAISDNPQLYKLENLLKRRLKRPDTSCDMSGEDLMIQQLLEGVYDKNEIRDMGLI